MSMKLTGLKLTQVSLGDNNEGNITLAGDTGSIQIKVANAASLNGLPFGSTLSLVLDADTTGVAEAKEADVKASESVSPSPVTITPVNS